MRPIILVAETGADIPAELGAELGIRIVPMHVAFDDNTTDDGTFHPEEIREFYRRTGRLPKTSGSTPEDFVAVFDAIHAEHPDGDILYLAYSAVTTCSYQSAVIAAEDRDYVTFLDTRQVSVGQGAIVVTLAELMRENPGMTLEQAVEAAIDLIDRAKMCFLPDDLEFLRAGGRVSNVVCLGSRILSIHPCIEILEGKLVATKKYRGKMVKVAADLIRDYAKEYRLDREVLWLVRTIGLSQDVVDAVEQAAVECGFRRLRWVQAGGVITTHGGPAAFGMAGFSEK